MEHQPEDELLKRAAQAREHAYAPYSHYRVGAAVRGKSGRLYTGCNVENASYGLTICAERAAIFKAISEGETALEALAVTTSNGVAPCGACRQVFSEFAAPEAKILIGDVSGHARKILTLAELLPEGFGPKDLE